MKIQHSNSYPCVVCLLQCERPPQSPYTALVHGYTLPGVLWAQILLMSVWCLHWSNSTQPTGAPEARWDASHRDGPAQISGTLQDERQAAWRATTDIYVSELNFHSIEIQCLCVHWEETFTLSCSSFNTIVASLRSWGYSLFCSFILSVLVKPADLITVLLSGWMAF